MRVTFKYRTLAIRAALTSACLAAAMIWPSSLRTADAQTVRRCPNTSCVGIDRCYFGAGISCSMTNISCTNTAC